jgi:Arc/MetJ-type ribon-helix-helix transcriptional regulator
MPELRVTISEKFDKLLEELLETGLFASKADIVRFATIAYLKELGFIGKRRAEKT